MARIYKIYTLLKTSGNPAERDNMKAAHYSESPIHSIPLLRINGELHLDLNALLMAWGVVASEAHRDIAPFITQRGGVLYIAARGCAVLIMVTSSANPATRDYLSAWYNNAIRPEMNRADPLRDRVMAAILAADSNGVTLSALQSKTQGMTAGERLAIIADLVEGGEVVEVVNRSATKPRRTFYPESISTTKA